MVSAVNCRFNAFISFRAECAQFNRMPPLLTMTTTNHQRLQKQHPQGHECKVGSHHFTLKPMSGEMLTNMVLTLSNDKDCKRINIRKI
jgi:hypothetical protein